MTVEAGIVPFVLSDDPTEFLVFGCLSCSLQECENDVLSVIVTNHCALVSFCYGKRWGMVTGHACTMLRAVYGAIPSGFL